MSLGNLLCLLTGFVLPFLLLAVAARRGLRPLAAASAYRNVAWKLGLEADTRGTSLQGYLHRRRLYVGAATRSRRGGRASPEVRAVLDLSSPLGLGLVVRRVDGRLTRWRKGRQADLRLGDPAIDDTLSVSAAEPERARALFDDAVRDALEALLERTADVQLTDHGILARLRRPPPSERALTDVVMALQRLAEAVERARDALPAPEGLAPVVASWAELAPSLGLDLDPGRPSLQGEVDGVELSVVPVRDGQGWCADVRAWLPPHAATGLRVWPEDAPEPRAAPRQDIEVGDAPFDEAFVVQGYDPRVVRRILGPEARAALLDLVAVVPLRLSDAVLEVQQAPLEARALADVVRGVLRAARALQW